MTQWVLIEGGTLIDGMGNPASPNTSLLVKNDRIAAVGDSTIAEQVPRGDVLQTFDARGKTVMPGLIDAHCHISFGNSRTQEEQDLYTSVELRTLRSAWNAQRVLRSGVTSISNPGGSFYIGVGVREGTKEGLVLAPRIATAGRFITTSNGLGDSYPESVGVPSSSIATVTNTLPEMVDEVRRQVKNGVDFIKLSDSPLGNYQAFTDDETRALADLAHQLGKRITIHSRGSSEVHAAVIAGCDWIMHANMMNDDVLGQLAESDIPLVPTLLLLANNAEWGGLVGVPPGRREAFKRLLDVSAATYHRARAAGVRFITGTDSGFSLTPYGEWHARELELLMEYVGLTALEAIQAATHNAAITVGLEGQVGALQAGYKADVLIVGADPLKDIRALQNRANIQTVILDGNVVEFPDSLDEQQHAYDRALIQATGDLTWDLVQSEGAATSTSDTMPWNGDEAHSLAHDLRARELAARQDH